LTQGELARMSARAMQSCVSVQIRQSGGFGFLRPCRTSGQGWESTHHGFAVMGAWSRRGAEIVVAYWGRSGIKSASLADLMPCSLRVSRWEKAPRCREAARCLVPPMPPGCPDRSSGVPPPEHAELAQNCSNWSNLRSCCISVVAERSDPSSPGLDLHPGHVAVAMHTWPLGRRH
jgi:hypothetical protein